MNAYLIRFLLRHLKCILNSGPSLVGPGSLHALGGTNVRAGRQEVQLEKVNIYLYFHILPQKVYICVIILITTKENALKVHILGQKFGKIEYNMYSQTAHCQFSACNVEIDRGSAV